MDPARCEDIRFLVEPDGHHAEILLACLRLMGKRLKRNICNLDDHAVLSEVKDLSSQQKAYIGDALEYACKFWTKHLLEIPSSSPCVEKVQQAIEKFFMVDFLHWIEVLVLTRNLDVGVYAMNDIEQWYNLVSGLQIACQTLYSWFLRQGLYPSGQMTVKGFCWNILRQSRTLLPISTILLSHCLPPLLGSTSVIAQIPHSQ